MFPLRLWIGNFSTFSQTMNFFLQNIGKKQYFCNLVKCRYFLEYTDIFKATSPIICPNRKCQKMGKKIENYEKYWRNNLKNTFLDIVLYQYFPIHFSQYFSFCFNGIYRYFNFWLENFFLRYFSVFTDNRNFRKIPKTSISNYEKIPERFGCHSWKILEKIPEKILEKYCLIVVFLSKNTRYFSIFWAVFLRNFFTEKYRKFWKIPGSIFR